MTDKYFLDLVDRVRSDVEGDISDESRMLIIDSMFAIYIMYRRTETQKSQLGEHYRQAVADRSLMAAQLTEARQLAEARQPRYLDEKLKGMLVSIILAFRKYSETVEGVVPVTPEDHRRHNAFGPLRYTIGVALQLFPELKEATSNG